MALDIQINFHNAVVQDMQMIATLPKTVIKWESRKYTTLRQAASLSALPFPVDLKKLQRRLSQLRSPGLKLQLVAQRINDRQRPPEDNHQTPASSLTFECVGMSTDSDVERRQDRGQAVSELEVLGQRTDIAQDEAYRALKRYQINHRRLEFLTDDHERSGGYGIVRKARLHQSSYLPTWLASHHYGPPEVVAVKQIKISVADVKSEVKRAFTKEMLIWSSLEAHPGIARFLGFYAKDDFSEAWLISPWEPNGNVREFIQKNQLEVPEKLSLVYDTIDALEFLHQLDPPVCHGDVKSIMTGTLPYEGTFAEYAIIVKIFEGPRPHVDGESRLSDCLQVWELMTRCWESEPGERPTSGMCRTAITFLPRCPPTLVDHTRSPELLENLGDLESWKGNYDEGLAYLEQALSLYERAGNERGAASVLRKQASVSYRHSYPLKAMKAASAALEKLRNMNDPLATAETLYLIGSSLGLRSENANALAFLKEALEIFRANSNDIGQCLERIGEIYRWQMNYTVAVSNLDEASRVARRCGDKLGEARVVLVLGSVAMDQYDYSQALGLISVACDIARKIGWNQGVCTALLRQSFIKEQQVDFDESERLARESIALARQYNSSWRLAQGLLRLGYALNHRGQLTEAAKALEKACALYAEISHVSFEYPETARLLFHVKHAQGNYADCLRWIDVAITEYRSLGDKLSLFHCFLRKGSCLRLLERFDEAALHYEASLVLASETGVNAQYARGILSHIVKTSIAWERTDIPPKPRSPYSNKTSSLLCDMKKLQRRIPQIQTASLKLEISPGELRNS
ncbi:hypothetical protein FRB90_000418 [Tulasnella sp. 427]|nr:hypothetical protein FRB90_000418 [Tulasnella sp. 427]